jgi:hypothetical protein
MSSPLTISNIVLSQSEREPPASDGTPKASFYRDVLQPNPVPVLLRVRRLRIVGSACALALSIAGVTVVLARGVTLATIRDAKEIATRAQRDHLVQNYNAYVAMVASLSVRPLQLLAALVMPVWCWSFFTKATMSHAPGFTKTKALVYASTLIIVWLLSNATHALNVQLVYSQARDGLGVMSVVNSTGIDPNARGNETQPEKSILRSAVTMDYRTVRSACARESPQRIPASIEYGFPSRPWMIELDTTSYNKSQVQTRLTDEFPTTTALPMEHQAARGLTAYAISLMHELFLSSAEKAVEPVNNSALMEDLRLKESTTIDPLWQDINTTLHKFTTASTSPRIQWFDTANTNVTVASTNLSAGFVFESLSLAIPFKANYLQRLLTLVSNDTTSSVSYNNSQPSEFGSADYYFDINIKESCGEHACIVSPRSEKATDAPADSGPQTHAFPVCLDDLGREDIGATLRWNASACAKVSTQSLLVLSFAQRVEGESFNQTSSNVVRLKNARKIYSVTIGRLRWSTTDTGSCAGQDSKCTDVSLRLKEDMAVTVGQDALPLQNMQTSSRNAKSWTTLVTASAQEIDEGANLKGDLILPALFSARTPFDVKPTQCESERGNLLASVEKQHWYSLHSSHHASTAALFWLFQDGVVGQTSSFDTSSSGASPSTATTGGSSSGVARLVMKVPYLAAALTYCGCGIVLLISVAVLLFSKRHESRIEKHFTPFHLAQTLVGASSPLVPSSHLFHSDLLNIGGDLLASSAMLKDFDIVSLTLRHRKSPTTLIQVPRPPSLTASASSTSSFLAQV